MSSPCSQLVTVIVPCNLRPFLAVVSVADGWRQIMSSPCMQSVTVIVPCNPKPSLAVVLVADASGGKVGSKLCRDNACSQ